MRAFERVVYMSLARRTVQIVQLCINATQTPIYKFMMQEDHKIIPPQTTTKASQLFSSVVKLWCILRQ